MLRSFLRQLSSAFFICFCKPFRNIEICIEIVLTKLYILYLGSFLPCFVHTDSYILILEDFFGDVHHQSEIPSKGGAQCPVATMQAARLTSQEQVFEDIKIINYCVLCP